MFVNVRLWPFAFFGLLALSAAGAGMLLSESRHKGLAVASLLLLTFAFGMPGASNVRSWARWNYEGAENKPRWPVFQKLIEPLKGTSGRLANDLHEHNNSFGSSRIFESVPHLIGKPILEGGLVNSAVGSLFSYYIQGETSRSCAGFPNLVSPPSFNIENATAHLKLFNVKHFVAKSPATKKALAASGDWRLITEAAGWQLHELVSNDGRYIYVPKNPPVGVLFTSHDRANWKKAGLEWMYSPRLLDQPFAFLRDGKEKIGFPGTMVGEESFLSNCRNAGDGTAVSRQAVSISSNNARVLEEEISNNSIKFRTNGIGLPHIIKCTYFPNWKAKGAKRVYMVTPCFMLVYPEHEEVELYYGYVLSDKAGMALSFLGCIVLIVLALRIVRLPSRPGTE